ncbi:ribonucleotide-diphosphate reductase subunit beta [Haemophilus influenzae PittHH]|nr:ribonucleotide-diphosphate reductase subunit beta [Haemophilus influenzae PittHH]
MEGNAKIIKFIARDEALHLTGTQHILNIMAAGQDDPEMAEIAEECKQEAYDLFVAAAEQEKAWADYLFKDGSMIGLNRDILVQYVEYITISVCKLLDCHYHSKHVQIQFLGLTLG